VESALKKVKNYASDIDNNTKGVKSIKEGVEKVVSKLDALNTIQSWVKNSDNYKDAGKGVRGSIEDKVKNILKRQGSSEYMGRKPGEAADVKGEAKQGTPVQETAQVKPEIKEEPKAPEANNDDILTKMKDADLSTFTDQEIEDAMKKAAAAEDYSLAVKLRDELKSRKEGN
jgi:hypothetical protein